MTQAKFNRTIIGWYNVTVTGRVYNVDPQNFTEITGIRSNVSLGCGELNAAQVEQLKTKGRLIGALKVA